MSATEVPEIVQLVFNMGLLAISSMSEVGSEHKVFTLYLKSIVKTKIYSNWEKENLQSVWYSH